MPLLRVVWAVGWFGWGFGGGEIRPVLLAMLREGFDPLSFFPAEQTVHPRVIREVTAAPSAIVHILTKPSAHVIFNGSERVREHV
eukprot:4192718-Amphidinium_carterae.1